MPELKTIKADEKIAVVGLFVDTISQKLFNYHLRLSVIKKVLKYQKIYKQKVSSSTDKELNKHFLDITNHDLDELIRRALDTDKKILLSTKQLIDEIFMHVSPHSNSEDSFKLVKAQYDHHLNNINLSMQETNARITRSIRFIDEIFGKNNELFIFMSELTINPYAISFLNANKYEEYLEFSKQLLVGNQSKMILDEINRLDDNITDISLS